MTVCPITIINKININKCFKIIFFCGRQLGATLVDNKGQRGLKFLKKLNCRYEILTFSLVVPFLTADVPF